MLTGVHTMAVLNSLLHRRLSGFGPRHHCTTASVTICSRLQGNIRKDMHSVQSCCQSASWFFPPRCSPTVECLIVYVILSRPRSLATLISVCLTDRMRAIIEQRPPQQFVATFHKLFDGKIKGTKSLAAQAAKRYGLLPGLIE